METSFCCYSNSYEEDHFCHVCFTDAMKQKYTTGLTLEEIKKFNVATELSE